MSKYNSVKRYSTFRTSIAILTLLTTVLNALTPVAAQARSYQTPLFQELPPHLEVLPKWMQPLVQGNTPLETEEVITTAVPEPSSVYNGDFITYNVVIKNQGPTAVVPGTVIVDLPPGSKLEDLECLAPYFNCQPQFIVHQILDPSGSWINVKEIDRYHWDLTEEDVVIAPRESLTVSFRGQIIGERNNTLLFLAYASYSKDNGETFNFDTNLDSRKITVTTRIEPSEGTTISKAPTWLSGKAIGGTFGQDWGDFDRDGDLDLALASSVGTYVFLNNDGSLEVLWSSEKTEQQLSYDAVWADVNPNNQYLELIVVGNSADNSATTEGYNYIYTYDHQAKDSKFKITDSFTSTYQLVRITSGDFDGDGDIDLIGSTNWINAPCAVKLYRNAGTGYFTDTDTVEAEQLGLHKHDSECISTKATASLSAADYDRDGDLDLALGVFPNTLWLLKSDVKAQGGVVLNTNPFTLTPPITVETGLQYIPYDLNWGDYNQDGYLDLAAAYPLQRSVHIYENKVREGGNLVLSSQAIRTRPFMTPLSVDWGDLSGDGKIDLIVADSPPRVYEYKNEQFQELALQLPPLKGQTWSIRAVDVRNNDNLDLSLTNRDGKSQLYDTSSPKLSPELTTFVARPDINVAKASHLVWGDIDGDNDLDVVVGSGNSDISYYYENRGDGARTEQVKLEGVLQKYSAVAIGDIDKDSSLDIVLGNKANKIYVLLDGARQSVLQKDTEWDVKELILGDPTDDRKLDLLVAFSDGTITLFEALEDYLGNFQELEGTVIATVDPEVSSLAWGNYNQDYYLDFAVGVDGHPTQVYTNNGDGTFSLAWSSPITYVKQTTAVAWADYDGDGLEDLAVGNRGDYDYVWKNVGGQFTATPVWTSTLVSQTTSIAWGDWDNDGYPELAVGSFEESDIVYANIHRNEKSDLLQLWSSSNTLKTNDVAWGDWDKDGDLDLGIAEAEGQNGYYENSFVSPAHAPFASSHKASQLPNNSFYVSIDRPGPASDAYFYSSASVLADRRNDPLSANPPVTIEYRLHDPEGDTVLPISFDYSLNGEDWEPATEHFTSPPPPTHSSVSGVPGIFVWNAHADDAVSDNAHFRICFAQVVNEGPVQSATRCSVSPPFRVRAQSCIWPTPEILVTRDPDQDGNLYKFKFEGRASGTGSSPTYSWDFGDGNTVTNQRTVYHTYEDPGAKYVRLIVDIKEDESDCPIVRTGYARTKVIAHFEINNIVFLPVILSNHSNVELTAEELPHPQPAARTPQANALATDAPSHVPDLVAVTRGSVAAHTFDSTSVVLNDPYYTEETRRITNYSLGVNSQPAINSNGSRIAYWTTGKFTGQNDDGNIEIYLAEVSGDGKIKYTQITSSTGSILAGFNLAPKLNSKGDRLVFFSDRNLTGDNPERNFEVYLSEILTETVRHIQVTSTTKGVNILPSINSDGNFIAFASDVKLLDQPDRNKHVPGGMGIYRAEIQKTISNTYTITYLPVTPIEIETLNDQPSISTDGSRIAFLSNGNYTQENSDGGLEVFVAEIQESGAFTYTQITNTEIRAFHELPVISADGTRVAFISDSQRRGSTKDGWEDHNPEKNRELFLATIEPDGQVSIEQLTVTGGAVNHNHPNISADGTRIAYIEEVGEDRQTHIYDTIEGGKLQTDFGSNTAYPALTTHGTQVAYVSDWNVYLASHPIADLAVHKSANTTHINNPSDPLTYTILVTNIGPSPARRVILSDTLPAGLEPLIEIYNKDDYIEDEQSGFGENAHGIYSAPVLQFQPLQTQPTNTLALPNSGLPSSAHRWIELHNQELLLHMDDISPTAAVTNNGLASNLCSCSNGPCPTSSANGKLYRAFQFESNQSVLCNNINLNQNFTVLLWVNPDKTSLGDRQPFISYGSGVIELGIEDLEHYYVMLNQNRVNFTGTVQSGWQHFAIVGKDNSPNGTDVTLYRNGEVIGRHTFTGVVNGSFLEFRMGINGIVPGLERTYYKGFMDEVALLSRSSQENEILEVYYHQRPSVVGATQVGYYDSKVMTETIGAGWKEIAWIPNQPAGKELPNYNATELSTNYPTGTVSMNDNVLLMHFNDPPESTIFLDSSSKGNDAECVTLCPKAGVTGRFHQAVSFDNSPIKIDPTPSINNLGPATWMMWVRHSPNASGYLLHKGNRWQIRLHGDAEDGKVIATTNTSKEGSTYRSASLPDAGTWFHLAVTWDGSQPGVSPNGGIKIYINGDEVDYSSTIVSSTVFVNDAAMPLVIGSKLSGSELDEVSVYDQLLSRGAIRAHYLRGAMQILFQVRSCQNADCSDQPFFVGPDGTPNTHYDEATASRLSTPVYPVSVTQHSYFQYRAYLARHNHEIHPLDTPKVLTVTVAPQAECVTNKRIVEETERNVVSCTLSSRYAPLRVGRAINVEIPVQVTAKTLADVITNVAGISGFEADHGEDETNNSSKITTTVNFQPVRAVFIEGPAQGILGETYTFTARVPDNTTRPITYTWKIDEDDYGVFKEDYTYHTINYLWTTTGEKAVKVIAENEFNGSDTQLSPAEFTKTIYIYDSISGLTVQNSSPTDFGTTTYFTANVDTGSDISYEWDFGDGQTLVAGSQVPHVYPQTGKTYTATVRAVNAVSSDTAQTTVVIDTPIQGLDFTTSSPTKLWEPTWFTVNVSSGTRMTYTLDFGDGTPKEKSSLQNGGVVLTHTYSDLFWEPQEVYTAQLTVTNSLDEIFATEVVTIQRKCWALYSGDNSPYPTLQDAIDHYTSTGTLKLAGHCLNYKDTDQLAIVDKSLTLRGGYTYTNQLSDYEGHRTLLDGNHRGRVLLIPSGVNVTIRDLDIVNGDASGLRGGVNDHDAGGGIYASSANLYLDNLKVNTNSAVEGGGLFVEGGSIDLRNSWIMQNSAGSGGGGGGIYLQNLNAGSALFVNLVIANNEGTNLPGGGVYVNNSSPTFYHITLADNQGASGFFVNGGAPTLHNTIVANHLGTGVRVLNGSATLNRPLWYENNEDSAGSVTVLGEFVRGTPDFKDPLYHIDSNSAAINAGADVSSFISITQDIDGDTRPIPINEPPDIGADEFQAGLLVKKVASHDPVQAGEALTYTIYVTNTGSVALEVNITDTPGPQFSTTDDLTWANIQIDPNLGISRTIHGDVATSYKGTLTNTVAVVSTMADREVTIETLVDVTPSIEVKKVVTPTNVLGGELVTYTIYVTNTGNADLTVRLTDTLGSHMQFPGGGNVWTDEFTVYANEGAQTWTKELTATSLVNYNGSTTNHVEVIGTFEDETATAFDEVTSTIYTIPGITVTKEAYPNPAQVDQTITYTIKVTNTGNVNLNNVTILDTLPVSVTLEPNNPPTFTESLALLEVGETWTYTYTATVTGTTILNNKVEVSTQEGVTATYTQTTIAGDCLIKLASDPNTTYSLLQDAINAASSGDIVKVAGECTDNKDYSSDGVKEVGYITKKLTIRGGYSYTEWDTPDPSNPATLNANLQGRVLYVTGSDAEVHLEHLNVTGGKTDQSGGGLYVGSSAVVTITHSFIYGNSGTGNSEEEFGGGLYLNDATLTISSTELYGNKAEDGGGGIYLENCGHPIVIADTLFHNNEVSWESHNDSDDGGALVIFNCDNDVNLFNNVFTSNEIKTSGGRGNAIFVQGSTGVNFYHTTIANNTGGNGAAVVFEDGNGDCTASFSNTIVSTQSTGIREDGQGNAIHLYSTLWHNVFTQHVTGNEIENHGPDYTGTPAFVDPANHDYRIQAHSAAIDRAGETTPAVLRDADGNPRPSRYQHRDLGAYEYAYTFHAAKLADPMTVLPSERLTYTILITNTGHSALTNVTVSDTLPANVSFDSVTLIPSQPGATLATSASDLPALASNVTVPFNGHVTLTFVVVVTTNLSAGQTINNHVLVSHMTSTSVLTNVVVTVGNAPPVAVTDVVTTQEEITTGTIDVLANDTDLNNDDLTLGSFASTSAKGGNITISGVGLTYTPTKDFFGTDTFTYVVSDEDLLTDVGTVTVKVTPVNDSPKITAPPKVDAQKTFIFTETHPISIEDDSGSSPIEVTIVVTNGVVTLSTTSGISFILTSTDGSDFLHFTGTITDVNTALDELRYGTDSEGSATIQLTVNDQGHIGTGGAKSDSTTIDITVGSNDAPVIQASKLYLEIAVNDVYTFSAQGETDDIKIAISDEDAGSNAISVSIKADHGTITLSTQANITTSLGNGTDFVVFTDTIPQINAALDGMVFSAETGYEGEAGITITANDLGHVGSGGPKTTTQEIFIAIGPNDGPTVHVPPATQEVAEDGLLTLSGTDAIYVTDPDVGSQPLSMTLIASNGTISLSTTVGLSFTQGDGTDDPLHTFSGTITDVKAALDGLEFKPATGYQGEAKITVWANDLSNVGSGVALDDTKFVNILVGSNDPPEIHLTHSYEEVAASGTLIFSIAQNNPISVTDVDAGGSAIKVTLNASHGTITLTDESGITFVTGSSGAAFIEFTGTLTGVNAALEGMEFHPTTSYEGEAGLSITVDDQGHTGSGGAKTTDEEIFIAVGPNHRPTVSVPTTTQQVDEEELLTLSTSTSNAVSVTDPDVGSQPLSMTLIASNGTISLSVITEVTFTQGDGIDDPLLTFTGTLAEVNTALDGLEFKPATGYQGDAEITVWANDLGNVGSGVALSDTEFVNILVGSNDPPIIYLTSPLTIATANNSLTLSAANSNAITIDDPDIHDQPISVTLQAYHGKINASTSLHFTDTLTNVNTAMSTLIFVPELNYEGEAGITVVADDMGSTGSGGPQTSTRYLFISVGPNDGPTVGVTSTVQTVARDGTLVLSSANANAVTIADPDAGRQPVSMTLLATQGVISLSLASEVSFTFGSGNAASMAFTGTITEVNTALEGMLFTPTTNYEGPAIITATVNDLGHVGTGVPLADSGQVYITVGTNDPPTVTLQSTEQTIARDSTLTFSSANANAITVADSDAGSHAISVTLVATNGVISLNVTSGLNFTPGSSGKDASMAFTGTVSSINTAMEGMLFTPTLGYEGTAVITATVDDLGHSGVGSPLSDTGKVTITVATNDPPTVTVPGPQDVVKNEQITFSLTNTNAITVADSDAGSHEISVTLVATNGVISLNVTSGLSFISGSGYSASMAFTGTISSINTAMEGMLFTPTHDYTGTAVITVTVNDLGHSGLGGPQSDTKKITIDITASIARGPKTSRFITRYKKPHALLMAQLYKRAPRKRTSEAGLRRELGKSLL